MGAELRTSEEIAGRSTPRPSLGRVRAAARLAGGSGPCGGLKPVLAEGREVDQEIDGVDEAFTESCLRIEHRFDCT
jgi:hypothetical protein